MDDVSGWDMIELAQSLVNRGELDTALSMMDELSSHSTLIPTQRCAALGVMVYAWMGKGQHSKVMDMLGKWVEAARETRNGAALRQCALMAYKLGRTLKDGGEQWIRNALQYLEEAKCLLDGESEIGALMMDMGEVLVELQRWGEALECLSKGDAILERLGVPRKPARARQLMGLCHKAQGRYDESLALLKAAAELERAASGPKSDAYCRALFCIGECYVDARRFDDAIPLLEKALKLSRNIGGGGDTAPRTASILRCLQGAQEAATVCDSCGAHRSERLAKCSLCGAARYCNAECQRAHWSAHKHVCKKHEAQVVEGCSHCHKVGVDLKACSRCHSVKYCGGDCQRAAWLSHKSNCK